MAYNKILFLGGRLKKIPKYVGDEPSMLTYGDGVCDINIKKLVVFHKAYGKNATMTAINVEQRFRILDISDDNSRE